MSDEPTTPEEVEPLQVYMVHAPMIEAFKAWVRGQGWHLQGPLVFDPEDVPTWFLQPMPSQEALSAALREMHEQRKEQEGA